MEGYLARWLFESSRAGRAGGAAGALTPSATRPVEGSRVSSLSMLANVPFVRYALLAAERPGSPQRPGAWPSREEWPGVPPYRHVGLPLPPSLPLCRLFALAGLWSEVAPSEGFVT